MRDTKNEVIHFWFEEAEPSQWFQHSESFTARMREQFAVTYDMAMEGLSNHWANDPEGALALCIVLDQFPRHLFKGTARAYESEERAVLTAKQAVSRGFDQMLQHEQRFFLYMPFEHSEQMHDQKRSLELFKSMRDLNPLAYHVAQQKFEIFEKFGRFPHRNKALGRENTPEEEAYLEENPNDIRITY